MVVDFPVRFLQLYEYIIPYMHKGYQVSSYKCEAIAMYQSIAVSSSQRQILIRGAVKLKSCCYIINILSEHIKHGEQEAGEGKIEDNGV